MSTATRVMNAIPSFVLAAPVIHRLMSGRYLTLEFTGRRSGRRYRTPVAYAHSGDALLISTDSAWWRNLVARPDVRLRLRGREVTGRATRITEQSEAEAALATLVDTVPGYRRAAGLHATDGRVSDDELSRAVSGERMVFRVEA